MPSVTHTVRETFAARSRFGSQNLILPTLREVFVKRARITTVRVQVTARESFSARSGHTLQAYMLVRERFFATGRVTPRSQLQLIVRESLQARDRVFAARDFSGRVVREVFSARDAVQAVQTARAVSQEQFFASDRAFLAGRHVATAAERFVARDAASVRRRESLREVFIAVGRASSGSPEQLTLRESFSAGDAVTSHHIAREHVVESFRARGAASTRLNPRVVVREWFSAYDRVIVSNSFFGAPTFSGPVPLELTDAFTADMLSWGMSRYVGLPVSEFDNVQFGVGPNGFYRATLDPVLAFVEIPDTKLEMKDIPLHVRKRLNHLYTYSEHAEALDVLVTADLDGARVTTQYQQEERDSTNTRAVRCQVGRGYASNYIRLRIGGTRVFDIASAEVEITPTKRRI